MESEPYVCHVSPEAGRVVVGEDVTFWLDRTTTGWALQAEVNTVPCLLGEVPAEFEHHEFSFMMLSAGDVEVNGHAQCSFSGPPAYLA